jgi:hypothetical protein
VFVSFFRVVFADLDEWRRKQNNLRNGLRLVERRLAGAPSRQPATSERGKDREYSETREDLPKAKI